MSLNLICQGGCVTLTRDEMVKNLEGYLKRIRSAYSYFDAYYAIYVASCNNIEKVNLAPGFFHVAEYSLYNSTLLELAKLFGTSRKFSEERTLWSLMGQVKANQQLFPPEAKISELLVRTETQLHEMDRDVQNLKGKRDKYLAHNDPISFEEGFDHSTYFPISIEEIVDLIAFAESLCMTLFSYLDKSPVCCRITNAGDLDGLMQWVSVNR